MERERVHREPVLRHPSGRVSLIWPHRDGADSSERRNTEAIRRLRWELCGRADVA
jgi:hypothetical protein